ncbi:hypothetical protein PACTADRAFT_47541 [Pachysolen tannophilus NRRL Y-2460]|uniref:LCCL domain-containing protein n=1 Tax=Pachysolen tannophilus NRRL Y-2460 TaxID=669874 RepID=A0A1E4U102_PACTA|nr:hypothetical protein PACTADRAFT_47541 [Pachysolen tannophilus NRRL Y-2460]
MSSVDDLKSGVYSDNTGSSSSTSSFPQGNTSFSSHASSYRQDDNDSFPDDIELQHLIVSDNSDSNKIGNSDNSDPVFDDEFSLNEFAPSWNVLTPWEKFKFICYKFWYGPTDPADDPPQFNNLFLKKFELIPSKLNQYIPKRFRILILLVYLVLWFLLCYSILRPSLTYARTYQEVDPEDGALKTHDIISLSCNDEKFFWKGKNAKCGLDARDCKPFTDREVVFSCPALCDRGSWTYSSIPIGDQSIKYRGYFVGGGELSAQDRSKDNNNEVLTYPYRADSFPCGAAIHSGILSPFLGGCAKISYTGGQASFPSKPGHYGVDDSIEFNTFFPASYVFMSVPNAFNCYDPRLLIVLINFILGGPVMYFCSGFVAFWIITIVAFWTICLALDPPLIVNPLDPESLPSLISLGLERLLPSLFILYVLWHFAIGNTLSDPPKESQKHGSPLSKLILWYPLFWLGILNNVTFDRLPVDRLTIQDIKEQPGSLSAIVGIAGLIITCAVIQAYRLWLTGYLRKYVYLYLSFIALLIFISQLKGLTLRVHHYILAMLLIPGTGTKGLSAMLFQGLLVGLFLSGASRWGLDSIAETTRALRRSDPGGTVEPPVFVQFDNDSKTLSWKDEDGFDLPGIVDGVMQHPNDELNGYSLLINDVERYKGDEASLNISKLIDSNEEFADLLSMAFAKIGSENGEINTDANGDIDLYLRISRASTHSGKRSDYTRAGILKWPSGEFIKPKKGVT